MTTPTNDRQTSERERMAAWIESMFGCERGLLSTDIAAQLRADEAKIAQLKKIAELHIKEAVDNFDEAIRLRAEIAALRAENEALRTVSPDDVRKMTEIFAFRIDCAGSPEVRERAMFAALQSFIRSKETRRE